MYQALNISVMDEGGCQQWHFDTNEVNMTLLLQKPEAGREFEYVPLIRSADNENYPTVKRVLEGQPDRSGAADPGAGDARPSEDTTHSIAWHLCAASGVVFKPSLLITRGLASSARASLTFFITDPEWRWHERPRSARARRVKTTHM